MNNSKIITYGIVALVLIVGGWYVYKNYAAGGTATDSKASTDNSLTYTGGLRDKIGVLSNTYSGTAASEVARKKAARFMTW